MTNAKARGGVSVQKSRPEEFRHLIEKAEADGATRADMVLRLTLRDAADLKRDRSVPVQDISFADGVMRYIGVKVTPGGVAVSALQMGEDEVEPAPPPAPPKRKSPAKSAPAKSAAAKAAVSS